MTRALMAAVAACLVLAGPAAASSYDPASPEFANAVQVAQQHWGSLPCGGQVEYSWTDEDPAVNATSYWSPGFSDCEIVFNRAAGMDAVKFCTVLVHELGHLHGRTHSDDPDDVMSAYYNRPLAACGGGAPAPAAPAPAPAEDHAGDTTTAESGVQASASARTSARTRAMRRCNRKQSRRAVRRCKRSVARRFAGSSHQARSISGLSAGALLSAPLASHAHAA